MVPEITWQVWLIAVCVITVGSFFQGIIGYGVAIFSAPLLLLIDPVFVPAPLIIVGGLLPLILLTAHHRAVEWRDMYVAWPGALLGVLCAWIVANWLTQSTWNLFFAGIILVAVGVSLLRSTRPPSLSGIASGSFGSALMGTITGVGGPPIGLAYQNASPRRIVGSLSAIFVPTSLMSLTALWFLGRFQLSDVVLALSLLPGMLGGFWLSSRITGMSAERIPVPVYKWLMLSVAALASVYTILREIILV